ncbi:hypothetical protein Godav_020926 [Gossypium davidsonii]|uniref:DUF4283 domain-containing protein n=2 Tax=Gossypium TaxID=3633 RepID=A0A7J8R4H3_GOSDV|nr:hypothetical protein [Gossypium davidsonii]MBA0643779.1 hypothetical protein [Gossypium klotzschianum]
MEEEFELKDGDVATEVVDGIPTIIFFDQVHKYIERRMAKTIIMKLLGRSIGFSVLLKKITSLWCPRSPIQLLDLENDYYLIRFNSEDDYNKVVFGGPWVIFGQYLTVSLWSKDFSTSQSKVDTQLVWVRLPGLPEGFYSDFLIRAIGQLLGQVVKLDAHTNSARKGRFARLVCGMYGHNTDFCLGKKAPLLEGESVVDRKVADKLVIPKRTEEEDFIPCILVERRQRRQGRSEDDVLTVINGDMDKVQRGVVIDDN